MTKLVCSSCEVEFRPHISGISIIEHAAFGPYKIWMADEWICTNCGATVITGFGGSPLAAHYESCFSDMLDKVNQFPEEARHNFENQKQREHWLAIQQVARGEEPIPF